MDTITNKANYCIGCLKKHCQTGCPLNNDTTGFIKLIKEEKYEEAFYLLSNTTVLSSICGRICPHKKQCEGKCIRGIKGNPVEIGLLESYIGDMALDNNWNYSKSTENLSKNVAVIGSGPAGLTCAAFLKRAGVNVTIYEKHNYLGGLLRHGIPDFRLPKDILDKNIEKILSLGIDVKLNQELGKNLSLTELESQYDAIFIAIGANISTNMNISGETLKGVYGGNELLEYQNYPDLTNKIVIVNGGGNVAMDVARTINKLGAKVKIVYRRSENEMPAELKEIKEAKEEGIEFLFQNNILKIIGANKVERIECIKTELIKEDNSSRLKPVNIPNTNYYIDCDYVIMAIGSKPEENIVSSLDLELDNQNRIITNDLNQTSNPKIFAGGDISGTKSTVAFASRSGINAAKNIIKYLKGEF